MFKFFHGITLIEDAYVAHSTARGRSCGTDYCFCNNRLSLHKSLKSATKLEFKSERDEECEDDEGNVCEYYCPWPLAPGSDTMEAEMHVRWSRP